MKQLTQKYSVISLLEPVEVGSVFSWKDWVLHVTFADVHFADWKNEDMMKEFEGLMHSLESFEIKTLETGELGDFQVVFIEKSKTVLLLHNLILNFLDSHKAVFNNPEWNSDNYIPHITNQKHAKVLENEVIPINNIAIVDMFPGGDGYMRKIIKVFELKR